MTTPTVILIQSNFYGKKFSTPTKMSMAVVCLGTVIATVSEVKTSVMGTAVALLGVLAASYYQIVLFYFVFPLL